MKQILTILFLVVVSLSYGQEYWNKLDDSLISRSDNEPLVESADFSLFSLNIDLLRRELDSANSFRGNHKSIHLPNAEGKLEEFFIFESSIMQDGLAEKFPLIKTYKGYSNDGKIIRLDINSKTFHGAIAHSGKTTYIDPYFDNDLTTYASYIDDSSQRMGDFKCGVDHSGLREEKKTNDFSSERFIEKEIPLRKYRYAVAVTGEFGKREGSAKNALETIVTHTNRINLIFEQELSIRLLLVDGLEKVMFTDPATDPYTDTKNGSSMLRKNTSVLNDSIGYSKYDLGHVYNTSCNVGGIAFLGSMCNGSIKGAGVTCASTRSVDYYVNVTAHEIGHQMRAQHTMNNCAGDNETNSNGFEPGSGTTIMSYAGLCGSNNTATSGDEYYHSSSLRQIYAHTRDNGIADRCAEKEFQGNYEPTVEITSPNNKYIPTRTAFILEGKASDKNAQDKLTYCWEQMNTGPRSPLGQPKGSAPRFRSYLPNEESFRIFPRPSNVFASTSSKVEIPSTETQTLRFHLTVRDNNVKNGTAVWEEIRVNTLEYTTDEGKFQITSNNSSSKNRLSPGQKIELTWNVGNTLNEKINAKLMDLYWYVGSSTDFSFEKSRLIADNISNNGSYTFTIPTEITNKGRFVLKADDNIFFDVNNSNIKILEPSKPTIATEAFPSYARFCLPKNSLSVDLKTKGYAGATGDITFKVKTELPTGLTYKFDKETVKLGEDNKIVFDFSKLNQSLVAGVEVEALIPNVDTFTQIINLNISNGDVSAVQADFPAPNASGISINPEFKWVKSPNATTYSVQVATSPKFGNTIIAEGEGLTDVFKLKSLLNKNAVYYWRIKGNNDCGDSTFGETYAFATESLSCSTVSSSPKKLISSTGTPTISIDINSQVEGKIVDLNVKKLVIKHDNAKNLSVELNSPDDTNVLLFENICPQANVSVGFDDEATSFVKCPINSNATYRSKDKLEAFNNKDAKGTWKLNISDNTAGNGGEFQRIDLEVCVNQTLNPPVLANNFELQIPPKDQQGVLASKLLVTDLDNTDDELLYTVTSIVSLGKLTLNGKILKVGDTFTQQDINNEKVIYTAPTSENGKDGFSFTVNDGQGGFIGITKFSIDVNSKYPVGIEEELSKKISVHPNPTNGNINIEIPNLEDLTNGYISDISGRIVSRFNINKNITNLDLSTLNSGVYYITIQGDVVKLTKKVVLVK